MQDFERSSSAAYLHCMDGDEDDENEFEELDPSGRYGRYKDVLGRGAFKTVYKAFDIVDGIEVAWNQIKVQSALHSPEDVERFYSEVHLLKTLKHKNIIKFYHSWVDTETRNLNFLTEIFTSGTLRQYRKRHRRIDIRAIKNWSRQILRGLLYLHSQDPPIIHRDLKCDNIFINGNQGEVKIGDLGLAAILHQAHAAHSVIGTPEFMAPELYEEEYTELVDIYSFGMCLLEMTTGEYPYSECSNAAQIYKKVTLGKKPAALNKVKNSDLRRFVEKCIATASRRLPARELLMDPFLQFDEVRDLVAEAPTTPDAFDGFRVLMGSSSDRQLSFMNRNLASVGSFSSARSFSSLPDIQAPMLPAVVSLNSRIWHGHNNGKVHELTSSHLIEDKVGKKMDFRVKGKRRENDIVYLRLRIADTEGQVRIIHFPFHVDSDTAMSVASEMVTELNLTDQDVTKIAEIIDAAIQVMVPEWKTGVAVDNAVSGYEDQTLINSISQKVLGSCDHLSTMALEMASESSLMDQSQHGSMSWQHALSEGAPKPPQNESTMHGRFEEVAYHNPRLECPPSLTGEECGTATSASSEELWDPTDYPSSPLSLNGKPTIEPGTLHDSFSRAEANVLGQASDLGFGSKNGVLHKRIYGDGNRKAVDKPKNGLVHNNLCMPSTQGINFSSFNDDNNFNLATHQLGELGFQYEQELRELQHKHEESLLDLKRKWKGRKISLCWSHDGSVFSTAEANQG